VQYAAEIIGAACAGSVALFVLPFDSGAPPHAASKIAAAIPIKIRL